ncbi:MAG: flagellar protein FliS, partial [Oscillospiraceae bacterium]
RQNYDLFEESVDRSIDILHYLDDTLDPQYPISRDLTRLYEFFCYELCRVKAGRNGTELARIKPMVMDLRDCFRTAEKNTAGK